MTSSYNKLESRQQQEIKKHAANLQIPGNYVEDT